MITRDEFDETFQPRESPSGEPLWSWEEAQREPLAHVWTVVTGDDGESEYAMPGYHVVNRVGNVVTTQPWRDETLDAVWYERDGMTLIERITNEINSDDDNMVKQSDLLIEAYETADPAGKKLLDTAFICLCGWSLKHLIEDDSDDEPIDGEEGAPERG